MAMQPGNWVSDTRQYLVEVQVEAKKITRPAQKEAIAGAIGVVVISTIFVLFLGLVDFGLGQMMRLVLG